MKRALIRAAALLVLGSAAQARAADAPRGGEASQSAETLFQVAKDYVAAGRYAEACPLFDQSKRLEDGVGVTLHLADCYEHVGRTASAWAAFLDAAKLARAKSDERLALAEERGHALEAKLSRVVFAVSPAAETRGVDVRVDGGGTVPPAYWTVGVALDPGDHVVTIRPKDRPARVVHVMIGAAPGATTVTIGDAAPQVAPAVSPPAPSAAAPALSPTSAIVLTSPPDAPTRRYLTYGLLGAGVVGFGAGAALLAVKNDSMSGGQAPDQGAAAASTVAFSVGAAALLTAVVLYLTEPSRPTSASAAPLAAF